MSGPGEVCLLLLHVCCAAARLQLLQPPALMAGSAPGTVMTQLHQVDHLKQPRLRQDLRNASDEPKRPGCHLPSGQNSFRKADRQSICSSWCDHNHAPEPAHCGPSVMPQHRHRSWGLQPSPWATPTPMLLCHCGSLSLTLQWRTASESRSQHAAWLLTACLAPPCSPLNAYVTVQPLPTGPPNAPMQHSPQRSVTCLNWQSTSARPRRCSCAQSRGRCSAQHITSKPTRPVAPPILRTDTSSPSCGSQPSAAPPAGPSPSPRLRNPTRVMEALLTSGACASTWRTQSRA